MNIKSIIVTIIHFFITLTCLCQSSTEFKIHGKIVDSKSFKPLELVNIILYTTKDSTLYKGVVTDINGKFEFNNIRVNTYFIEVSYMGYETLLISEINVNDKSIDLGTKKILISNIKLDDVIVSAKKSVLNTSIDRKVYNVEKDIQSQTGSASDILQNIPSISVDVDGTVALRGSTNVTFFINGKPSTLLGKNSAVVLQQMPSNNIERIEVITNPSAKYKPDGTGGIINIVLKKDKQKGFNGLFLANAGNNNRYNTSMSLNYNTEKINIFGNYGIKKNNSPRLSTDYRINRDSLLNVINYYGSKSKSTSNPLSQLVSAGIEFQMNDKNKFELSGNSNFQNMFRIQKTHSNWKNPENILINDYTTKRLNNETEMEWDVNGLWEHQFKKDGHVIQFELNLSDYAETEDNHYLENHAIPTVYDDEKKILIKKSGPKLMLYAEYTLPINNNTELEAGYVMESFKDNLTYLGKDYSKNTATWIKDENKSNEFISNQQIHAVYSTFSHTFDRLSFMAGLRAERALITSKLLTLDSIVPNNYFKVYPTVHLAYEINENQELQLNYSKRIKRADSDEMNPFPEYSDPRNIASGNPKAKPEQIHSIEFGYHLKTKPFNFIPSIYYRYKYDGFTEIKKYVNDSILLTTFANLSKSEFLGTELIVSANLGHFVSLNFNINGYYTKLDASNIGYSNNRTTFSFDTKLGVNINYIKSGMFQLNSYYRSKRINTQGTTNSLFYTNIGLKQDLLKNKASIVFTVSDLFNSLNQVYFIDTPLLWQKSTRKRDSQIVFLGFTYRFGTKEKHENQELNYDDKI
ncbi:TonB-dependent receptor domain-containing protein [Mariniflexile jejuense]|uniref:TonB-dependent receptor domain-containing protein n=1 Tax=Mariniflexile jejuense TaxID=1173582 RepID=A0ABW3JNR1_9FLAO